MLSLETPAHKQTHCMITRDTRINTIDCPNAHLMAIKIISLLGRTHRWKLRATTSPSSSEPVREKGRRQKRGQVRWQRTGRQILSGDIDRLRCSPGASPVIVAQSSSVYWSNRYAGIPQLIPQRHKGTAADGTSLAH
jgi:hypothetical protein